MCFPVKSLFDFRVVQLLELCAVLGEDGPPSAGELIKVGFLASNSSPGLNPTDQPHRGPKLMTAPRAKALP